MYKVTRDFRQNNKASRKCSTFKEVPIFPIIGPTNAYKGSTAEEENNKEIVKKENG